MLRNQISSHNRAVMEAVLVTFLWSTSWVLIKFGLNEFPPVLFAGLRYSLATLFLLPFALRRSQLRTITSFSKRDWLNLAILGLVYYAITQGVVFLSLFYLPAMTTSLLFSSSAIVILLLGLVFLGERPVSGQLVGILLYLVGVACFFFPLRIPGAQMIGWIFAGVGVLANSISAVLGRSINRSLKINPILVTVISMGIGAIVLLATGLAIQKMPPVSLQGWLIIAWLAIVNSALAFYLWNRSLQRLTAVESGLINNSMVFQIAILAWLFLGEPLSLIKIAGILISMIGIGLVTVGGEKIPRLS